MDRHHRLQQAGRTGTSLEMADIALGRAEGYAAPDRILKDLAQALHLDHIADLGAGAVGLDHGCRRRVQPGVFPGAAGSQQLPDRIGRSDALALAIARAAHAADHGIDAVSVPLSIGQALE